MKPAICKKCGYVMKNVPKSHADLCYECEHYNKKIPYPKRDGTELRKIA